MKDGSVGLHSSYSDFINSQLCTCFFSPMRIACRCV